VADPKAVQIENDLRAYGFSAPPSFLVAAKRYIDLLLRWNRTISLTTVTDPDQIVRFHFGESIFALSVVPIENGRLADVGSGAGFPGLALAMARPGLRVTLVEASAKKFAFLNEAVRELGLKNSRVLRCRMEEVAIKERFEFTTARALGRHDLFLKWSRLHLNPSGKVVLWLGGRDVTALRSEGGWSWSPEVSIPGSKQRFLLFGSPQR
jgi:16S rRNA (guanine527-N7)-methyltransferase